MAGSQGSFYTNNTAIYEDTNPAGPSDTPVPQNNTEAPSSFFKGTGSSNDPVTIVTGLTAFAPVPHNWLTGISDSGLWYSAQPLFTDISGVIASAQVAGAYPGITQVGTLTNQTLAGLISATGGQIAFPATQNPSTDANTLDDYEEGTWTPTVTATTTPPTGVTYGVQYGEYTKVGNRVQFGGVIVTTNKGTGAVGNAIVAGLPYTTSSSPVQSPWPVSLNFGGFTFDSGYTLLGGQVLPNATTIKLQEFGSGLKLAIPYANLANATTIQFEGSFII